MADETKDTSTRGPTVLEVVCECLGIIEELPPDERACAIDALQTFAQFCTKALKCKPRSRRLDADMDAIVRDALEKAP